MSDFSTEVIDIEKINLGDHAVLFYKEEIEMLNATAAFIKNSLKNNERCLYIDPSSMHKRIINFLKESIADLDYYLNTKQLLLLTKEDSYGDPSEFDAETMINLIIEEVKKAKKDGYKGFSITGELKEVVDFSGGKEEVIKYEWKLHDKVFKKYPVSALCRYNIHQFDKKVIKAALELHDYIVWQGRLNDNPYYIDPNGYKENKVEEYEIKSWLENIDKYQKKKKSYKKVINKTQKKYYRLYNAAPIGIVKTTSDGTILQINQKMVEIAGFEDVKEAVNNYNALAEEFYVNSQKREVFLKKLKKNGEVKNFEFEAQKNKGEKIWLIMNAKVIQENPDGTFVIEAFVFDITEKKKYERQLQRKKEELFASNQQLQAYNEEIMAMNEELENSYLELEKLNNKFEKMISLISDIDNLKTISEEEFLSKILKQAVEIVPEADSGSIYTFGDKYVNFVDCIGYDLEKLKKRKIKNEAFYSQVFPIEIIDTAEIKKRNKKYMKKNGFEKLKENSLNKSKEIMYLDLEINGRKKAGISLDITQESSKEFTNNSKKIFAAFNNIASSFYKLKKYNSLQNNFTREIISSTIKMLEMYDLYTKGHSENVADLAVKIAKEMELSKQKVDAVYWAGLVHDIGKLLIPLDILNKNGKLSDSEYEVIQEHPVLGSNALSSSISLEHIAKYVRHHHERWDGQGYPEGLAKNKIPIVSQILCTADAWDAMRSKRTYRDSLSYQQALLEISDNKGSQFAPDVADALLKVLNNEEN